MATIPLDGAAQKSKELRHYEVELIIFAYGDPRAAEGEYWTAPQNLRYPDKLLRIATQHSSEDSLVKDKSALIPLDPDTGSIGDVSGKLQETGFYIILLHQRWQQEILAEEKSLPILIQGGKKYGTHHELEGVVQLSQSRYLHLNTDLWFSQYKLAKNEEAEWELPPPAPPPWPEGSTRREKKIWTVAESLEQKFDDRQLRPYRTVRMKQKRRMRSRELHYLDHPLLGLMIRITPLTETEIQ